MPKYFLAVIFLCLDVSTVQADQVHQVGVRILHDSDVGINAWSPTIDYLSASIPGHLFVMVPYTHLTEQLTEAKQGKFDFILTNPSIYVELNRLNGAHALVTLVNKRQDTAQARFGSVIFTRADRDDIIRLRDLRGKHLEAVSPLSFGGWRVAWREMLRAHFDPYTELGKLSFSAGSHTAVVKDVREGKVDAGVVRTDMLERMASAGDIQLTEFRILHNIHTPGFPFFHSTPLYPEWPFAVMPETSHALAAQVKAALLRIKMTDPAARAGQYVGWTEALDYTPVDELHQALGIGPYQRKPSRTLPVPIYPFAFGLAGLVLVLLFLKARRQKSLK